MKKVLNYVPLPALILTCLAIVCGIIHLISLISVSFADFFNLKIATGFRFILAKITGILPFSFAEILIILLPLWLFLIIFVAVKLYRSETVHQIRFLFSIFAAGMVIYSSFVLTFATAYRGTPLEEKLNLKREELSADDISSTLATVTEPHRGLAQTGRMTAKNT